jgi:hypothetical protein
MQYWDHKSLEHGAWRIETEGKQRSHVLPFPSYFIIIRFLIPDTPRGNIADLVLSSPDGLSWLRAYLDGLGAVFPGISGSITIIEY